MLNELEATKIIRDIFPDSRIDKPIDYRGVFVFPVFGDDPLEGGLDPFFSVDQKTGEVRDFSIITDGDPKEIDAKFLKIKSR